MAGEDHYHHHSPQVMVQQKVVHGYELQLSGGWSGRREQSPPTSYTQPIPFRPETESWGVVNATGSSVSPFLISSSWSSKKLHMALS